MNYLDIGLIILLIISFFVGLKTGLISAIFSLAGIILGIWVAGQFYQTFSDSTPIQIITFIIIFVLVAVIVAFLGSLASRVVDLALLGWLNSILGGIFSIIITGFIIALGLAAYLHFVGPADLIANSVIARVLLQQVPVVVSLLPEQFRSPVSSLFPG